MSAVKTSFLILSDTHGAVLPEALRPQQKVDVVLHCGDLTEHSQLHEFHQAVKLLDQFDAALKLVIPGNHDFTLDTTAFKRILAFSELQLDYETVRKKYGVFEEGRAILARAKNVVILDEGTHRFQLPNGAKFSIYASPYTPSKHAWGFQFDPDRETHQWDVEPGTDIVITHGPPQGILDLADCKERAGSASLFAAVARAQPRLHCFGHIHEGWGAQVVSWNKELSADPCYVIDVDHEQTQLIESQETLYASKLDTVEEQEEKTARKVQYRAERVCEASLAKQDVGKTLFVNAAIQGRLEEPFQLPWIAHLDLARA